MSGLPVRSRAAAIAEALVFAQRQPGLNPHRN